MSFSAIDSFSGTLVASTAQAITFGSGTTAIRYPYVLVENTGTGTIYVRTDGTAATIAGAECMSVVSGESKLIGNASAQWYQSANVIPVGTYTGAPTGAPLEIIPPGSSLWGGTANTGTSVSVISSGTPTFTITGTG